MARQKIQPKETGRKKRAGSTAVVPKGYELVKISKEKEERKPRNSDPISKGFRLLARHKWQLTPWVGFGLVVWAAASSPVAATITLAAVAVLAHLAATRGPEKLWGRTRLSVNERTTVRLWAGLAAAWCYTVATGTLGFDRLGLGVLAALFVVASLPWWKSRRTPRPAKLSKHAKDVATTWPLQMAIMGPAPLKDSRIVPGSLVDLDGGSLTFMIDLAENVHSKSATGDEARLYIERKRNLGVGTVQVEKVHDHSGRIQVTLTPERHLEKVDAAWPGPVVHDNGEYDFAVTYGGETLRLRLYDKDGVKHLVIVGSTGGGKSVSLSVAVMAAFSEGAVIWYADGGGGDSAPWLAGACDWWAVGGLEEWKAMIQSALYVSDARGARRGAARIGSWRGKKETDPVLMVVFDEASSIARQLKQEWHDAVLDLAEKGRKRGIMVVQVSQHASVDRWIGGGVARDQMRQGGAMVGHAVGSGMASLLAVGGTSDPVDLTDLPEEPGFAHVIRQGKSLPVARVLHATEEKVLAELKGKAPRALSKEDQVAAGDGYRLRVRGVDAASGMDAEPVENVEPGALRVPEPMILSGGDSIDRALNASALAEKAAAELRRDSILTFLAGLPAGANPTQVGAALNMPRQSASRHLAYLEKEGRVMRDESGVYSRAHRAVSA